MSFTGISPWPSFSDAEADAVADVLRSNKVNYWTGDRCREFERRFSAWSGAAHSVSLANGTVALDLALKGLGIGPGDEVVVTPRTFLASVTCVINAGATPVFADVCSESGNITPETVARVLTDKTRAIIPVHLGGWPCDMTGLMALANTHDLKVIEDCAQAHGAQHRGKSVGTIGHVGAWSFCQDKIMTTGGEGGMVTTNDEALWRRMWSFKDHGKDWDAVYNREHPPGYRWLHESVGTNWRMIEMQAAIGLIQLEQMADWTTKRTAAALAYADTTQRHAGLVRTPMPDASDVHAYYRFYCYVKPEALREGWSRDRIVAELNAENVPAMQGSCSEVYLEKAFDDSPSRPHDPLPNARKLGECSIALPTHPTLQQEEISRFCQSLDSVLARALR